jgi:hypothetical protein
MMAKVHIEVKDMTSGEIVKKFDFDPTALTALFDNDVNKTRQGFLAEIRKKYPEYKYQISEMPVTGDTLSDVLEVKSKSRSLWVIGMMGGFYALILGFLRAFSRTSRINIVFIVVICFILVSLVIDYIVFALHGIHSIKVDSGSITIFRGAGRRAERIEGPEITDVQVAGEPNRRSVIIQTGQDMYYAQNKIISKSRQIRIPEKNFSTADFNNFIVQVSRFKKQV